MKCVLAIRDGKRGAIIGYAVQDWQDMNIACEGNDITKIKPVHFPCVYYRGKHESVKSFKARILLEHTFLTLSQFSGL